MGKELFFVNKLHNSTKRKYLGRMSDNKVHCMKIAKKYGKDYWDGNRRYGYGGYKYIKGRWKSVAKKLIKRYKLKSGSKVLDVGCGKGYLLREMLIIQPGLVIHGIEPSKYAYKFIDKRFKKNILIQKAEKKLPFKKNYFDLVISLATLHNLKIFNLKNAINEIERVGKKKYIMLESYRNNQELFNLQCWALTCETFFSKDEWVWFYRYLKYSGDYEFIYFK